MKLRPVRRADIEAAATLLAEGFPVHACDTWLESLRRLFAHVEARNEDAIGYIASAGGADIGIGLAFACRRSAFTAEPHDMVNLAAFYLRPGHEWLTPLFLRRMMTRPDVEYLDITASDSMRVLNRRIGFADRTAGSVVVPTPLAALTPAAGIRLLPLEKAAGLLSPEHHALLEAHDHLDAMPLVISRTGRHEPLILVGVRRKHVPGARVILARDRALLATAIGPIARYLLRRGLMFLEFDSPAPAPMRSITHFQS